MYLRGFGTATPAARYTKAECLVAFENSEWFARLDARSHVIARTVLQRDNGIEARRLAVDALADVFTIDPNTLAQRFLTHAPALAARAGERALAQAGLAAIEIDALVVSTCTGYICPGLSGHVVERLGLRADVQAFDLVGQGCAAALPNLQLGRSLLSSGAAQHVLSVCVEVSSAAMYLDNDPGVLISACLFGDGAGAAVLSRVPQAGGRDVLLALERRFEVEPQAFRYSSDVLREYGNLSSAFVYFVLEAALADDAPDGWWWLSAFGAGFSCTARC